MATTVTNASELMNAVSNAGGGDEIVARGGTYDMNSKWTVTSGGSSGSPLVIRAASGETPTIKFAAGGSRKKDSGIQFRSPYVVFRGFEVTGSGWKGVNMDGNAHDTVFENLSVHNSHIWGIMNNGQDNVVYRNCDSYDNMGGDGGNSDGFNMTGPAKNGLIEGCRAWNNGDDGFDMWVSQDHTIRYCWAWNNGRGSGGDGNGFKLGGNETGGGHLVHHCVSYNNSYRGFDWNTAESPIEVYNCTAVDNPENYRFLRSNSHVFRNNVSKNGEVRLSDSQDDAKNSWNVGVTPSFLSTDPSNGDFMELPEGSDAINAGTDVGLTYSGESPDLGAMEYGSDSTSGGGGDDTSRVTVDGSTTLAVSEGSMDAETRIDTNHSGYNGVGFVNFIPDSGGYLQWPLEVASADTYNYEIRYANGDSDRTAAVSFDGNTEQLTFPSTGAWNEWGTVSGTMDLPSGNVDLTIETTGEDGGNVDKLTLWPVESSSESSGDTPNHGYNTPDKGQADWHTPLNENFEAMDRDIPVADVIGVRDDYEPAEGALYFATDTGDVYVGDGSDWQQLGSLQ